MNVRIKTTDGEIHVFKATDAIEPLRHYTFDRELHTFRLQTSDKSEIKISTLLALKGDTGKLPNWVKTLRLISESFSATMQQN